MIQQKQTYLQPEAQSIGLRPLLLQTFSGGGTAPDDPIVDSNPDDSDDDSRAKDRMNLDDFGNLW